MGKVKDLKGISFGKLQVVEEYPERAKNSNVQWQCMCECGSMRVYPIGTFKSLEEATQARRDAEEKYWSTD